MHTLLTFKLIANNVPEARWRVVFMKIEKKGLECNFFLKSTLSTYFLYDSCISNRLADATKKQRGRKELYFPRNRDPSPISGCNAL